MLKEAVITPMVATLAIVRLASSLQTELALVSDGSSTCVSDSCSTIFTMYLPL